MTQGNAPAAIPRTMRERRRHPSFQTKVSARPATIAEAGAEGYSVTVAHPAARPRANPHNRSPVGRTFSRKRKAQAKAKTKHAPASACPQNNVEYAHIGVASPSARAANAEALPLHPDCSAIQNRHAHAEAIGRATPQTVTQYARSNKPRGDAGSTPRACRIARPIQAVGTASSTSPGALSE